MIDLKTEKGGGFIPRTITRDQAKDTGMAMVLVCLIIAFVAGKDLFFKLAVVVLLINMIWPDIYRPVAKLWLGLSHLMGTVMSKIILSVIFFVMVTPVGLIRRLMGADSLQLKKWKKGSASVFRVRDHKFEPEDVNHPF